MCIQSIRVLMGSMLTMFVYQVCGPEKEMCEPFHMLQSDLKFSLFVNFISLVNFVILYISETKRQMFLIENFDVDKSLPDDNLKNSFRASPELKKQLVYENKKHTIIVLCNIIVYIINVFISGFVIVFHHYGGTKTLSGFIGSILLVSQKLGEDIYIMYECHSTPMKGLSTSLTEPVSYNSIEIHV